MQVQSSKKLQNSIFSSVSKHKIILAGFIIVIIFFFFTHNYFLASRDLLQSMPSNSLLVNQGNNTSQKISANPQKSSEVDDNDIYLGPIKLNNSGYISGELDFFIGENGPPSSVKASNLTKVATIGRLDISLKNLILNPVSSISELGSSFIADYINNGRRTTLIKLVDSVSRYYVSYNIFPKTDSDVPSYDWVDEMVEKNEMSGVYSYILEKKSPVSDCGDVEQTGYCYDSDGQQAIIYVQIDQVTPSTSCGESKLFFLWSSADNKLGEVCIEGAPSSLSGFTYLDKE